MTSSHRTQPGATGGKELGYRECLARLGTRRVGHLAVIVERYPEVIPVNYRLDGHVVVFQTHVGAHRLAAIHHNVAFEVDHVDEGSGMGWSVLVKGMAEDVTDRGRDPIADRTREMDIDTWRALNEPRLLRIIPAHISGNEFRLAQVAP